ncbi:MAG: hypothetical protein Alis3KO_21520 [Aliiglaciecola sp.]
MVNIQTGTQDALLVVSVIYMTGMFATLFAGKCYTISKSESSGRRAELMA